MRRIFGILIIIAFAFLIVAFIVPPVRDFVWGALGPPIQGILTTIVGTITGSSVWQAYIAPYLLQFALIFGIFGGIFLSYIWHRWIFNPFRGYFVQHAQKEVGPVMTSPLTQSTAPTPLPIATTKEEENSDA